MPNSLDIEFLKKSMSVKELKSDYIYHAFDSIGISYGKSYRGIVSVYRTDKQLLAQLKLPSSVDKNHEQYTLHPSMIDSAMQSALILITDLDNLPNQLPLPFTLERLTIFSVCTKEMYAWSRYSDSSNACNQLNKLDIDLVDAQGVVCAQIWGVSLREHHIQESTVNIEFDTAIQSTLNFESMKEIRPKITNSLKYNADKKAQLFIQQLLASQLKVKNIDNVKIEQTFMECGITSSDIMVITQAIQQKISSEFSPKLFFEYETPLSLAMYLLQKYQSVFEKLTVTAHKVPVTKKTPLEINTKLKSMGYFDDLTTKLVSYRNTNKYRAFFNGYSNILNNEMSKTLSDDYVLSKIALDKNKLKRDIDLNKVETLLIGLVQNKFSIWVENEYLHVRSYHKKLPDNLQLMLEEHSAELAAYLLDKKYMPVSSSQKRYWTLSLVQVNKATYNVPLVVRFKGKIDRDILHKAFVNIVNCNQQFRAIFPLIQNELVQCVSPYIQNIDELSTNYVDLSKYNTLDKNKELQQLLAAEACEPINPKTGPILRIQQINLDVHDYMLVIVFHHTGIDGYSIKPLLSSWQELYQQYLEGREPIAVKDHVDYEWQVLRGMTGIDLNKDYAYWIKTLKGAPDHLSLPTDFSRPKVNHYNGSTEKCMIAKDDLNKFKQILAPHNITQYAAILSILKLVLYKWTEQKDMVIGATCQLRESHVELHDMIGDFTNFIPIRSKIDPAISCMDFFKSENKLLYQGLEHKQLPFTEMIELSSNTFSNINPIYNVLALQQDPIKQDMRWAEEVTLEITDISILNKSAMLDLIVEWCEVPNGLWLSIQYNTDLFKKSTISQVLDRIKKCLVNLNLSLSIKECINVIPSFNCHSEFFLDSQEERPVLEKKIFKREERPIKLIKKHDDTAVESVSLKRCEILKAVEYDIRRLCAGVLALPLADIDTETSFHDLGFQSVNLVQLASLLNDKYQNISATEIYQYPNVSELANYLASRNLEQSNI